MVLNYGYIRASSGGNYRIFSYPTSEIDFQQPETTKELNKTDIEPLVG